MSKKIEVHITFILEEDDYRTLEEIEEDILDELEFSYINDPTIDVFVND